MAADEANREISMASVAAGKLLYIRSDQDLELMFDNPGNYAVKIRKVVASKIHADFTKVYVTNVNASDAAKVTYAILGD